ncbi:hypothetical protein BT96DRAFT_999628 [Gymnopus androsaceus JB14]|uniref:Uncharacterized protein n=1 Tax=Gymnopus androsaceus JB14 TaxID=1447944 RepID=A0A6A4H6B1_9AGAR|nr:hypothetical protein BT96DRAFT_999628 [Gymnopus androsaceus JB14]
MKRRRSSRSEEDAPLTPANSKQQRFKALERRFSNLTLQHLQPASSLAVASPFSVSSPPPAFPPSPPNDFDITAMEVDYGSSSMLPFIQPDSVEEPHSSTQPEQVPEIRMKGSSCRGTSLNQTVSLLCCLFSHHPRTLKSYITRVTRTYSAMRAAHPVPELSLQNQQALVEAYEPYCMTTKQYQPEITWYPPGFQNRAAGRPD